MMKRNGKRWLTGCVGMFIAMLTQASEPMKADTLIDDTTRNAQLEQYLDRVFGSQNENTPKQKAKWNERKNSEIKILKISGGPMVVCSEVEQDGGTTSDLLGVDYMLDYMSLSLKSRGRARGFGFTLKGSFTLLDGSYLRLFHAGPTIVWGNFPTRNHCWRWEVGVGAGMCISYQQVRNASIYYFQKSSIDAGIGIILKAGVERRLSEHFGLGLEMNPVVHTLFNNATKPEGALFNGFVTFDTLLGMSFYF